MESCKLRYFNSLELFDHTGPEPLFFEPLIEPNLNLTG